MAFAFTRAQLLAEADRYIQNAAALPDSDPAKQAWIKSASDLSNVVQARINNEVSRRYYDVPDDGTN
jgi:hypothetical protein